MARNRSFKRRKSVRATGRKVVIICEGEKTEYGYFEAIRVSMRLPTINIHVMHAGCTDPYSIVCAAIEEIKARRGEKSWGAGDSTWVVFDGDEHKDNNPDNWNNALQLANSNKINLAISNPSFELWYLLHFQDQHAKITRRDAIALLGRYIAIYKKTSILWPEPLQPLTKRAIIRAALLADRISREGLEKHANPCSGVGNLVEFLFELEEEIKKV